ncbi:MAG: hypothetical protein WCY11_13400 [Novosphingobium sp.]
MRKIGFRTNALLAAGALLAVTPAHAQNVGDWVLAPWEDSDNLFPGVVVARSGQRVTVRFDDGTTEVRLAEDVRPYTWRPGSRIECMWTDGEWYEATIVAMGDDGTSLRIRYDEDGTMQNTQTGKCRTRV